MVNKPEKIRPCFGGGVVLMGAVRRAMVSIGSKSSKGDGCKNSPKINGVSWFP